MCGFIVVKSVHYIYTFAIFVCAYTCKYTYFSIKLCWYIVRIHVYVLGERNI